MNNPASILTARFHRSGLFKTLVGLLAVALSAFHSAQAATFYWDTDGATAGSGAATGTWSSAGSTAWSTDATGSTALGTVTTANTDDLFIAAGTNGTTGTITVSGAVLTNSITFDDPVAVTISGGTSITLGGGGGTGTGIFQTANGANVTSTSVILGASSTAFAFSNSSTSLLTIGAVTGSATSGTQTITVGSTSSGGITLNDIIDNGAAGGVVALLVKSTGSGVVTLAGANTYTGTTTINAGTLDLGGGTANGSISSSSALSMGGGTLSYSRTGTNTQTFNGTTLTGGYSSINNTVSTNTLALGALTQTAGSGGSVNFSTVTGAITTTTTANTNGILGGWATVGNSGLSGATADWAANDGSGNIVAYTGYTNVSGNQTGVGASTQNWRTPSAGGVTATLTTSATVNSLVVRGDFSVSSGATMTLDSGGLILSGISRWLLNNGAGSTAGTGAITSGLASGELFVDVASAAADANNWRIWTKFVDNGATAVKLVKTGPGLLALWNYNTFTGGTVVNSGTLNLSVGGGTGAIRGTLTINSGATVNTAANDALGYNANVSVTTVNIFGGTLNNAVGGNNAYIATFNMIGGSVTSTGGGAFHFNTNLGINTYSSATTALVSANLVNRGSALIFNVGRGTTASGIDLNISGVISTSGGSGVTKTGAGTLALTGANTYTGTTIVSGGTLQVGNGTTGSLTSNALTFGGTGAINFNEAAGSAQAMGALTFSTGDGTVQSTFVGTSATLTFSNVVARTAGATGNFVVSGGTNGSTNKIVFTQVAGATPTTGALLDKGWFFGGSDYAAYDTGLFIRALAYGSDTNAAAVDTITSDNHVKLTATPAIQNSISLLTLNLAGSGVGWTQNASQTLTLSAGGLIKSGGGTVGTISGGTGITTGGAVELVIRTDTASDLLTISTAILNTSTGGLTKSGLGTLTLSGTANAYAGATTIDGGMLTLSGTYIGGGAFTVKNTGTLNVTGTTNGNIIVGPASGGVATANISGTVTLGNGNTLTAGNTAGGTAIINISTGAVISGGNSPISAGVNGFGVINVTGGTVTPGQFLVAGIANAGAVGIWNISGGTVNINSGNAGTLGASTGTIGVVNITGTGIYNSSANNGASGIFVGENGAGILNVSGSGSLVLGGQAASNGLRIGHVNVATASGIVNLGAVGAGGGTITTNRVSTAGTNATSTFNFHGGTLKSSTTPNAAFMTGLTNAFVYGEGGTIDNNAQSITIGQGLLVPTGNGVSSIAVTGGAGFTAAPYVAITGGGGTGATAVAVIDSSGNLTGIIITNPGTGYTSAPTVTLTGGNGAATSLSASLAANTSGGLTFQGSGTTRLSGASTYSGATAVNAGTLNLTGSITDTAITVSGSAILTEDSAGVIGGTSSLTHNSSATTTTLAGTNTYTGATLVNAGTLNLTGSVNGTAITVSGSAILTESSAGVIGGASSLTHNSSATTTALAGTNTYTGATLVSAGTLTLSGAGSINSSSGITINGSDAKLIQTSSVAGTTAITLTQGTLDGTGTVGALTVGNGTGGIVSNGNGTTSTLTLGSVILNGAATLNFRKVDDTSTAALAVTNALTTTPVNGQVTLNVLTAPTWTNGSTYNMISYGSFSGANTDFTLGTITSLGARQSATIGNTGAGSGFITLAITGDTPVWTGLAGGAWTTTAIGGAQNWKLQTAGTGTEFLTNDQVLFNDTAAGTTAVTINDATVSPASVIFDNSTKNYTLSGSNGITSGTLVKNGTGTVTISTANTYAGETNINGGTLIAGNGAALGSVAAGTTVASGATLDINSQNLGTEVLTISGSGVGGNGALVNNGASDQINATGRIVLAADATIGGTRRWDLRNSTPTLNMGGFTLTKTGANLISLVGVSVSNAGHVVINDGRLNIETSTNLGGSSANTITVNSGATLGFWSATNAVTWSVALNDATIFQESGGSTISGPVALTGANTVNVNANTSLLISGGISGAGGFTKTGGGVLTVSNLTNSYGGGTVVSAGRLAYDAGGNTGLIGNINPFGAGSVTVNSGAQLRLGTNVGGHNNSVFNIANAVTLNGGAVLAEDGIQHLTGTVNVAAASTLGSTFNGGGFDINKGLFLDGVVSGSADLTLQQSGINTGANYNTSIVYFTNNSNTYSGTITVTPMGAGNGGGSYVGINATSALANATVNLGGNNTSNAQQFGTSPIVFNTGLGTATIGALSGSGNVVLTGYNQSTHAYGADSIDLDVGGNGADTSYSGVISGGGSLTKSGTGTMTLSNTSTYTGNTTVSAGTLLANNTSGSATGSGNVTVQSGARLGGNGLVGLVTGTQNITVNNGGILSIGNTGDIVGEDLGLMTSGAGVITLNGTLEFDIYDNLGGTDNLTSPLDTNDLLNLTSDTSIVLGGTLKVTDTTGLSDSSWIAGDTWRLLDWSNVTAGPKFSGGFSTLDLPDLAAGLNWLASTDGNGFYITVVVVPESSRAVLMLTGLMALVLRRRRSLAAGFGQSRATMATKHSGEC
ncbi:MAG: autotransporter-associated beta strand repeat-containing protein [Prosthecobacter sp.]|uniref:autotransporter-associated beta strand repeat-containing protein n=1 Tax=Prosthecobacter sp. TaxID=1965333 RepID=UPI0025DD0D8A|nr:autotransporter-associated beta strand repeat-containing protein [Prosthecobacter sp.]MCF7786516.1 autotransporter-associated beta strand repeat-containing protein [Prosthecobacter sp.]